MHRLAFVALGLTTAAVLFAEIVLTRFFSFRLWYHYAFMVISVAMLGLSSASAAMAVARERLERMEAHRLLAATTLAFAISLVAATHLLGLLNAFFLSDLGGRSLESLPFIALSWLVLFVPFFFAGCTVSWAIRVYAPRIDQAYAYDLVGAGIGAVSAALVLRELQPEQALGIVALAAAAAALLFFASGRRPGWRVTGTALLTVLLALPQLIGGAEKTAAWMTPSKGLSKDLRDGGRIVATRPNTNGRVDVVEGAVERFAWGVGSNYRGPFPEQLGIRIDGDAFTAITRFDGDASSWQFSNFMPSTLPYAITRPVRVLLIGPGGGMDVVNAVNRGAERVVGVEVNRRIIELIRDDFSEFTGGIYRHPRVEIVYSDGRNFVEGTNETFDLVQLTLVDTFAAISSGALSLSEDFLYTKEAFQSYLRVLSPSGMLVLGRTWREVLPLTTLLESAVREQEVDLPRHLLIADNPELPHSLVLLFKKTPLTPDEVRDGVSFIRSAGLRLVHAPGLQRVAKSDVAAFLRSADRDGFVASYRSDITPETDDRPFYFRSSKWAALLGTYRGGLGNLWTILVVALLFASLAIVAPLKLVAGRSMSGNKAVLGYFAFVGLGFIFLELALMTKLVLFLGHPVRSLTVTLFTLLLFSGLGSALSRRLFDAGSLQASGAPVRSLSLVIGAIAVLVLVYSLWLTPLLGAWMGLSIPTRIAIAVAIIAPLGLLMGTPMPIGIALLDQRAKDLVLWAWGINGVASVIGSVGCIITAHAIGFADTFRVSAVFYLAALLAVVLDGARAGSPGSVLSGGATVPGAGGRD